MRTPCIIYVNTPPGVYGLQLLQNIRPKRCRGPYTHSQLVHSMLSQTGRPALTIKGCGQQLVQEDRSGPDQLFIAALSVWPQQEALDEVLCEVHSTTQERCARGQEHTSRPVVPAGHTPPSKHDINIQAPSAHMQYRSYR